MNIIAIPFHDYRKIQINGYRNRDTHLISNFVESDDIKNVILINRPISGIESVIKKAPKIKGELLFKKSNFRLYKIKEGYYVIDSFFIFDISVVFKQKKWIWASYGKIGLIEFILECLQFLNISSFSVYNSTLYSIKLISRLNTEGIVFDAFDNWIKFPIFEKWKKEISNSYIAFSEIAPVWLTNSNENREFYLKEYNVKKCIVLKNGVETELFSDSYNQEFIPFKSINYPIIGFGGSVTHLINVELLNFIIDHNPGFNFVIVGPVLNKSVYNQILKRKNLHFFGNIHYDEYPNYVKNFDIGIIPYNVDNKAHGGDSIKFYEYLAAKKPVVSTNGNGVYKINDNVYISEDPESFNKDLKNAIQTSWVDCKLPEEILWSYKTKKVLNILRE